MTRISYNTSAIVQNAIRDAEQEVVIGCLRPSESYWTAKECAERAKANLLKAIAALDEEISAGCEVAE